MASRCGRRRWPTRRGRRRPHGPVRRVRSPAVARVRRRGGAGTLRPLPSPPRIDVASCMASAMIWSRRAWASFSASRVMRVAFSSASASTAALRRRRWHGARARPVGGVEATLLEGARDFGVGLGPNERGLVGRVGERTLTDLRGGTFGADELELGREPGLAQRRDRLAAQPLDLLLRAAALGPLLGAARFLGHRGPRLRNRMPRCAHTRGTSRRSAPPGSGVCSRRSAEPGEIPREGSADGPRLPRSGRAGLRGRRAVVDEPDQPAASWGALTYRPDGRAGPGPGRRARRASASGAGERVAIVTQNAARLLTVVLRGQRLRAGSWCRSTSASTPTRSATSSSTPGRRCCSSIPSSTTRSRDVTAKHRFVIGDETDAELYSVTAPSREPWAARRGRDRHHQLHERHHRAPQGRAAHPPQPLAQRGHVRLADGRRPTATCTCTRCRCSTATAGA